MKNALRKYRDPFVDLFTEFGNLFEDLNQNFAEYPHYNRCGIGKVNIHENENDFQIDVSVPGFKKEELTINLENGILNVSAEHESKSVDETKNYSRKEFSKKSFSRSFKIPETLSDDVDAKLEDGILSLTIKKKELPPKAEPKRIDIK